MTFKNFFSILVWGGVDIGSKDSLLICVKGQRLICPFDIQQDTHFGHILFVDNYLTLSLKSTRELSNCRPKICP